MIFKLRYTFTSGAVEKCKEKCTSHWFMENFYSHSTYFKEDGALYQFINGRTAEFPDNEN